MNSTNEAKYQDDSELNETLRDEGDSHSEVGAISFDFLRTVASHRLRVGLQAPLHDCTLFSVSERDDQGSVIGTEEVQGEMANPYETL